MRLTSDFMPDVANKVAALLRNSTKDNPYPSEQLAEDSGLTTGQLHTIIKYMRRCSEEDLEKFIRWYPLSCKRGYYLAESWNDLLPCFVTLYQWSESLKRTIEPMRIKMDQEGIDWRSSLFTDLPEDDGTIEEMNKDTAWFLDD